MINLQEELGDIDIYLLDQILRGRITPEMTVVDAGCGGGRNLVHLLRRGAPVFGVDERPEAVAAVRSLAAALSPGLPADNFRVEAVERMSFPDAHADVVISSAVLHFARNPAHLEAMLHEMWRVLRPGGILFCRLASTIGLEARLRPLGSGRYALPDGSERLLVDEAWLLAATRRLGGTLLDPLKTTNVQNLRCMTTWVVRKTGAGG